MKRKFWSLLSLMAVTVFAVTAAMGYAGGIDMSHTLELEVDWVTTFTMHTDGLALTASAAAAGVEEVVKEVKAELEKNSKALREELKGNLDVQVKELEARIKKGEDAGEGVSELKEESSKRSEANAKFVEQIEAMVKAHADTLNQRLDEIKGVKAKVFERPNYGKGLADAVTTEKMTSQDYKRRAIFKTEGMLPHVHKDISVTGATVYEPHYVPGIIGPGQRQLRVRDLLPRNRTSANTVFFVLETALTDNAGPQDGLGTPKGETTWQITVDNETVQTIAHFVQVPTQLLDDIPALEDYINNRMLFLLDQEEEDQLLYGTNANSDLNGLMGQATAFDTTLLTELDVDTPTDIDRIRCAIAQVNVAEYPATGIVMHQYNWAGIEMTKDGDKRYLFASPQDASMPRLWGLPVVATSAMTSPDFLVGAFQLGASIWDKQQSQISISTEDADNFQRNMATVRAEERIALTVYRPLAFVEGELDNTVT